MIGGQSLEQMGRREVVALHAFFVAWFRDTTDSKLDFAECEHALGSDFRMITPDGAVHDRLSVVNRLRAARGSSGPDFSIEIVGLRAVWQRDDAVLLEFIEQQYRDGRITQRRSTGLLTGQPSAPRGVVWRHLQETWMNEGTTDHDREESTTGRA